MCASASSALVNVETLLRGYTFWIILWSRKSASGSSSASVKRCSLMEQYRLNFEASRNEFSGAKTPLDACELKVSLRLVDLMLADREGKMVRFICRMCCRS